MLTATFLATEAGTSARSMLQLRLSGRLLTVASDLLVVVRVEPAEENRMITVAVDSSDYLRASSEELEGADAPLDHHFWFKHLPEGDYIVIATLQGTTGTGEVVTSDVQVGPPAHTRR
jgi:hypothetical protein